MDDGSLADLMVRDTDAGLAAVYQRYADRIHDYCRSMLRDDADAADATQDTFLVASARIGQLRDRDKLRPWLYAIARNRCHRTLRDRKRQLPTDDLDQAMSAADPVDARRLESTEAQALVWEAAAGLEDPDRDVLDLHLRHGLTGADLAAAMGTTAPQANQALHRMRERLNRSVGATLAIRYGRSDCDELRTIVGQDPLTPLLRKRVARHIERCGTCERHRHAGTTIFASIPIVGVPKHVWAGLETSQHDPTAAEQTATDMQWTETGFPVSAGTRPAPPVRRRPARRRPRIRPPVIGAAAAVLVLMALGAILLSRTPTDPDTEAVASPQVTPSTEVEIQPDDNPDTSDTTVPTNTTPSTAAPPPTATEAPPDPPPSTSGSTTTFGATIPTVTFIADGQAPTMALAVDCTDGVLITATLSDNIDPEPNGDLTVSWPPSRTRSIPQPASGSVHQILLSGDDLAGFNGLVDFGVSGRITDQAGNISDVFDTVSCLFFDDG